MLSLPLLAGSFLACLGAVVGYRSAGIGGGVLYGALIGIGGALIARFLAASVTLGRRLCVYVLLAAALAAVIWLAWGVYL